MSGGLLWRNFPVIEGKIFKPRVLHHASVVICPEQTLKNDWPAAETDPKLTYDQSSDFSTLGLSANQLKF
jgi:hypothetical protein